MKKQSQLDEGSGVSRVSDLIYDRCPLGFRAKQSQFASGGRVRPSPRPSALRLPPVLGDHCAKQSQFAHGQAWPLRRQSCETKPIPRTAKRRLTAALERGYETKCGFYIGAKQSQFRPGRAGPWLGPIVRNKANSPQVGTEDHRQSQGP